MRVPFVLCAVVVVLAACDGPTDPAASPTLSSEASLRAHIDLRVERAALASAADALSAGDRGQRRHGRAHRGPRR